MESPPHQSELVQTGDLGTEKTKEEGESDLPARKPGSKAQGRKRTKTGCLTCRRRRIKCGEERPTCQNCTKSKRQCEGYNQRVVFKDPVNPYRGPPISSLVQFSEPTPAVRHGDSFQTPSAGPGPLPIAPKPSGNFSNFVFPQEVDAPLPVATSPSVERRVYGFHGERDLNYTPTTTQGQHSHSVQTLDLSIDTVDRSHVPEPRTRKSPQDQATHYDFETLEAVRQDSRETPAQKSPLDWSTGPNISAGFYQVYSISSNWQPPSTASSSVAPPHAMDTPHKTEYLSPQEFTALESAQALHYQDRSLQSPQERFPVPSQEGTGDWKQSIGIQMPQDYYPGDDNDPYDVSDDENMGEYTEDEDGLLVDNQDLHLRDNDLGVRIALQARQEIQNLSIRTITSYIDRPNMLANYVPSPQASPLQDPMTARIFCHFINVTGPTMSMFERHPANPSLIFQGQPVPRSEQHIWTYTFPTLALRNQGLLHAILAVASLHIAKLQNGPLTASLKHYAYGLRKVAKSVSLHTRRGHPATLAAAMLLAFYECWSADHQKWSNHLLGARMLVQEIDFAGMTKHIKTVRLQQRVDQRLRNHHNEQHMPHAMHFNMGHYQGAIDDVDENIVSMLMGRRPQYDQYGRILEDNSLGDGSNRIYTEQDMEIYETQRDLFWWYAKQDTYQSILGGGRLFMEYSRWITCPPRAPLGRLSATYGTFDHLILLMGRLADFASKDVKRKRLAMKANGGYRPPGMPPMRQGQPGPPPQMPSFTGMVPGVGEAQLPMGFEPPRGGQSPQSNHSAQSEDLDLEVARIEAEEEWQEIRNAFSVIADHFGGDFQALGPEFSAPIQTPFGPALQYRTYGIAGIWLNYYMALITCHRVHPSMPPAAMMAAGITARHTEFFANEIGRIAAGIAPECGMQNEVSPGVGAALIESGTALFIAAVQYQNNTQRRWTVDRLRDIARLTGWQTALAICAGVETSWMKVAELGKGPPYVRISDERIVPDTWHNDLSRKFDRASSSLQGDGRMVVRRSDRVHYALGILTLESDFENFDLDNDDER